MPLPSFDLLLQRIKNNDPLLLSIDLSFNEIGDSEADALADALTTNTVVKSLDLSQNLIAEQGAKSISRAIKINQTITLIDLSWNRIGTPGAVAISESLKANTVLASIDLSVNAIGIEGINSISEALKVNATLGSIYLSQNNIEDLGAEALSEALKINKRLTHLTLTFNTISNKGLKAISESLEINDTLETLNLSSNPLSVDGREFIMNAFSVNYTLQELEGCDQYNISPYLIRNRHLFNALNIIKRFDKSAFIELDRTILQACIQELEALFPELRSEAHDVFSQDYLTECYRILIGLDSMCQKEGTQRALVYLLTPFRDGTHQARADKAIALLLATSDDISILFNSATPEEQVARYQWILYGMRNYRHEPALNTISALAFINLFCHADKLELQQQYLLMQGALIICQEDLLKLVHRVLEECQLSSISNPHEINFLCEILNNPSYRFETLFWLGLSSSFISYIKREFPGKFSLAMIESMVYVDRMPWLFLVNGFLPISQQDVDTLKTEMSHLNFFNEESVMCLQNAKSRIDSAITQPAYVPDDVSGLATYSLFSETQNPGNRDQSDIFARSLSHIN